MGFQSLLSLWARILEKSFGQDIKKHVQFLKQEIREGLNKNINNVGGIFQRGIFWN